MSRPKVESIDPQPTSKCHHAPVHVKSSDEGTSYYVCNKCGKPCDIVANYNGLTDMPQGGGAKGATSQGTGCYFNPMRHRTSHSKTTGDIPSLQPLREAILALDKLRQNHQIDNPEYVDRLVELIETREREAIAQGNDILRSALAVAERKGANTNWPAFKTHVNQELARQYTIMYPRGITESKEPRSADGSMPDGTDTEEDNEKL